MRAARSLGQQLDLGVKALVMEMPQARSCGAGRSSRMRGAALKLQQRGGSRANAAMHGSGRQQEVMVTAAAGATE